MPKKYVLKLSTKSLDHATDMLRYDCAYRVELSGDEAKIDTLRFTSARWASFNTFPALIMEEKISVTEERELSQIAEGFLNGVRFAGRFLNLRAERDKGCYGHSLVEGT